MNAGGAGARRSSAKVTLFAVLLGVLVVTMSIAGRASRCRASAPT
ncbi:hypothetical protein AB0I53_34640 [Saccharopolyspora sp. NPDC050389]